MITIGSMFTGYGGLDMGVRAAVGGEVIWHADNDPASSRVLAHHWPCVPNLGDITAVDWSQAPRPDVLTGGFPCQDVSVAGAGIGLSGSRSGLWSVMATAIKTLRPRLVVIENVRGLLHAPAPSNVEPCPMCVGDVPAVHLRALGAVLGDLADIGYDARWCGLRAADVGAPHGRFRVFVAASDTENLGRQRSGETRNWGLRSTNSSDAHDLGRRAAAIRRWETVIGRTAPSPTAVGKRCPRQLSPAFVEWMMGLPAGHVTDVPGVSRIRQLGLLGNGVVPQQAAAAVAWLTELSQPL
jgi:DNA (cytosine-5)-methyltransferase 1